MSQNAPFGGTGNPHAPFEAQSTPGALAVGGALTAASAAIAGAFGVNGNAAVGKAGAIASPAAEVAPLKTAIDAIRVALQNVGITA
jgi:hypothetical protein